MKTQKKRTNALRSNTTVNGTMTFAKGNDNLNLLDFACSDDAGIAPFAATCRVQAMRDGNVYITEKRKRERNRPLMRTDNASLSLSRDRRYYFVFTMAEDQIDRLPDELAYQALELANRFEEECLDGKEGTR